MIKTEHSYQVRLTWTGSGASGTESYTTYSRDHIISAAGNIANSCNFPVHHKPVCRVQNSM